MKNKFLTIVAASAIILIGGLAIVLNTLPLKLEKDKISSIVIRNGTTGEGITLETEKDITALVAQFNDLRLVRSKKLEPSGGYTVSLTVYHKRDARKFDQYSVNSAGINYQDYLYSNGGEIDFHEKLLGMID